MNRDHIRDLADVIEFEGRFDYQSFFADSNGQVLGPDLTRNAEVLAHKCGTVGCVAGWAVTQAWKAGVDLRQVSPDNDETAVLAYWLEIDYDTADSVAYGGLFPVGFEDGRPAMSATAVEAAKALREWADGDRRVDPL